MAYISASDLTKMMMDYLKDNGCEVWRNNNLAVRGRAFIGKKGKILVIANSLAGQKYHSELINSADNQVLS